MTTLEVYNFMQKYVSDFNLPSVVVTYKGYCVDIIDTQRDFLPFVLFKRLFIEVPELCFFVDVFEGKARIVAYGYDDYGND